MPEVKAITPDYGVVSKTYDQGRPMSPENLNFVLNLISNTVGPRKGAVRFLDLGCGTGRIAIPVAQKLGYKVTGADNSLDMIAEARMKAGEDLVRWDKQVATQLTYDDNTFEAVFMSHVLHHIRDPRRALGEVHRVLVPGGVVINRYGAIEHIKDDPEHRFFPEALKIDLERTPSIAKVERWLREEGFKDIRTKTVNQVTYTSPDNHLERTKKNMTSVLHMISDEAFQRGVERFEEYLKGDIDKEWLLRDLMSYTTASKAVEHIIHTN